MLMTHWLKNDNTSYLLHQCPAYVNSCYIIYDNKYLNRIALYISTRMCIKFGYLIITVGLYLEYNFQILKSLISRTPFCLEHC